MMRRVIASLLLLTGSAMAAPPQINFNGAKALEYTRQFVAIGPRWVGSPGHAKAEAFLKKTFARDHLEEDTFTAQTPAGLMTMHNFIVKFPGSKPGEIVLASHYETNYPLRNINFVGANDGGSSTGLLIEAANHLRGHVLDGPSVWLVFFDGEEAFQSWSHSDSLYGSKHLAAKWQNDGTLKTIKAFLLADMIGDKDLDIDRDLNSTPWLLDTVDKAAAKFGYQSYFFQRNNQIEDDHLPFMQRGVPCADIIDINYGYEDSYHHTAQDTMDKLSARSLTIVGDVFLETIQMLDQR
ncbi:M28 family peptidase [Acidipila rosea]|uniref:Peptidase M28-like protein n=1 Tax=Acidipila rosea TaxID=768535 RepID=A0A4R1L6D9_9BACT|nr:M28 family peptidase [Acidipila rosea]TCK73732.1 peptidase M28-like protein [Acidipila rosea]